MSESSCRSGTVASASVEACRLDSVWDEQKTGRPEPFLMKMDIEDHWVEALNGARSLLRSTTLRHILLEVILVPEDLNDVGSSRLLSLLEELDFSLYLFQGSSLIASSAADVSVLMIGGKAFNLLVTRDPALVLAEDNS